MSQSFIEFNGNMIGGKTVYYRTLYGMMLANQSSNDSLNGEVMASIKKQIVRGLSIYDTFSIILILDEWSKEQITIFKSEIVRIKKDLSSRNGVFKRSDFSLSHLTFLMPDWEDSAEVETPTQHFIILCSQIINLINGDYRNSEGLFRIHPVK